MNGRIRKAADSEKSIGMPIIGKIKVGKKNERGLPQSTDYFICDSKYQKYFIDAYGEKPDAIQIAFISNEFRDSCNERYECRDKDGRLMGYGDGESMYLYDIKSDSYKLETDRQKLGSAGKWDTILTLKFVVLGIKGVFGLFSYSTKGVKSSLPQIRDAFDTVIESAGTVINIPFDLIVKKVISQKPGSKFKFPVVSLIPNINQSNIKMIRDYLNQGNDIKQLGILNDENITKMISNE